MTELNISILSKIILLETRILDWASRQHDGFWETIKDLSYTKYSWRIVKLMLQLSPWDTALVILGRFIEGVIPSMGLRIKGEFLDIVIIAMTELT